MTSTPSRTHAVPDPAAGQAVRAADRAHVFHSWSAQGLIDPLPVAGAEGSYFWDYEGNRYLDFSSQLVNTNIGHQHPKVVAAIQEQAGRMCTLAPGFAVDVRVGGRAARRGAHPRRPGQDLLHQRRRRGRRERGPHGAAAHRPPQGAEHLPLVPRPHRRRDQPHRRTAPLAQRHGRGGRRALLRPAPLPLALPRRDAGAGVRTRSGPPRGDHRLRGPGDDRRGHPGDRPRHRRRARAAAGLPRGRPRDLRPVRHRLHPRRGHGGLRAHRRVVRRRPLRA